MLKNIGVVVNKDRDVGYSHTRVIINALCEKGFIPVVSPEVKQHAAGCAVASTDIYKDSEFIICIGGDGTLLATAREAYRYRIPVLGINKGSVGFLAEVETGDIELAVDKISRGEIRIQSRMVLDARIMRNGNVVFRDIAINDAVVSRIAASRILKLRVSMDDKYVDSFPGDGIIVSTPTGSTAYSLSAGGPIVQPDMRLMITTPICPHLLYSRSFITPEDKVIRITLDDNGEAKAMLTMDGQSGSVLHPGDVVEVRAAAQDVLFASVSNTNFFDVLRAKIHGCQPSIIKGEDIRREV
jgi:ATP-NAD kinase.